MPESNQKLRSEAVQDILTKMPHWMIMWGNTIMLLLVLLVFFLASIIKYPDIVEVEARVEKTTGAANQRSIAWMNVPVEKINQVKPGQIVHIKLFEYPDMEYGVLQGEIPIKYLSKPDESGFYQIRLSLGNKLITSQGNEIILEDDMYGVGEIFTEEITLLDRVFYRFKDFF